MRALTGQVHGPRARRLASIAALSSLLATGVAATAVRAVPAQAASFARAGAAVSGQQLSTERSVIHWINVQRVASGLKPLVIDPQLTAVAHKHVAAMARSGRVFHDPALGHELKRWLSLGEDVGSATRLADLEQAFATTHFDRLNLFGANFRQIGVGAVTRDGLVYVTVILRWPQPPTRT